MDYLAIIPVTFHYKGKEICRVESFVYPQYSEGQTIQIDIQPTNRERVRRPARDFRSAFFQIERVHHIVNESLPDIYTFRVEIVLIDVSSLDNDDDKSEPSIPRRLRK